MLLAKVCARDLVWAHTAPSCVLLSWQVQDQLKNAALAHTQLLRNTQDAAEQAETAVQVVSTHVYCSAVPKLPRRVLVTLRARMRRLHCNLPRLTHLLNTTHDTAPHSYRCWSDTCRGRKATLTQARSDSTCRSFAAHCRPVAPPAVPLAPPALDGPQKQAHQQVGSRHVPADQRESKAGAKQLARPRPRMRPNR